MDKTQENEPRIRSIEKGWGDDSEFFNTESEEFDFGWYVDEIKEEVKKVGLGEYGELYHTVYRGYLNGKLKFEMGASIDVTVVYC